MQSRCNKVKEEVVYYIPQKLFLIAIKICMQLEKYFVDGLWQMVFMAELWSF